ncbi:hypothetical protein R1flu_013780 [Riccia fluitans]|uniref:Uncharacterized protein n=1 Tax=Riccia fluitans TaxID=41844 RepID=A0ABD1YHQ7_9MARC
MEGKICRDSCDDCCEPSDFSCRPSKIAALQCSFFRGDELRQEYTGCTDETNKNVGNDIRSRGAEKFVRVIEILLFSKLVDHSETCGGRPTLCEDDLSQSNSDYSALD